MARVHLVRHGAAEAGWGDHADPGLSARGWAQAEAMADAIAPIGPRPLFTSPLLRTRETAAALGARWSVEPTIEPRVAELPPPAGMSLDDRVVWLRALMDGRWTGQEPRLQTWRNAILECLLASADDAVFVTHFIAINVAIGAATGDDRVVCRGVDNCSVTTMATDGGALVLLATDPEAASEVIV
jgi:broad specificity phosphatase PhoE